MVSLKNPKVIAVILIALIIFAGMGMQTLVSYSPNVQLSNGKVYTLFEYAYAGGQDSFVMYSKDYDLSNGSVVKPTKNVTVYIETQNQMKPYCQYGVRVRNEYIDLNLFPYVFPIQLQTGKYYEITGPAYYKYPIEIKTSSSSSSVALDPGQIGTAQAVIKDSDGNGVLTVSALGFRAGASVCPSPSETTILRYSGSNALLTTEKSVTDEYNRAKSQCWLGILDAECINRNFKPSNLQPPQAFYSMGAVYVVDSKDSPTIVKAYVDPARFGAGSLSFSADQDFFNSVIFTAPRNGKPQISSILIGSAVSEETSTAGTVIVSNTGEYQDVFTFTLSAVGAGIDPQSGSISVPAGSQASLPFMLTTSSVNADTSATITAKLCANNQFIGQECTMATKTVTVKNGGGGSLEYCGNNVCGLGETYENCPQDCKKTPQQVCAEIQNSKWMTDLGKCGCEDGYSVKYDSSTGKQMCEKAMDAMLLFGVLAFAGALIGGYMIFGKRR